MGKALVVDDSKAMRLILTSTLREAGFEVEEASDGQAALDLLDGDPVSFGLILLDWNMPRMNGLELLRRLRADPANDSLVIIMVTTETEREHIVEALQAGANEYVMKPFTKDMLLEKLQIAGMTL